ncbi:hypothetical protein TorRG33x02_020190 [Trema orientale]|uniref:Transmembrane protein n=1 Tax=Trema orientale TaxID=63057 RepID=A0A2P5FWT4_TREOI|nr:hypothetical protein TorRG33x02_020190 [Trema orientale]
MLVVSRPHMLSHSISSYPYLFLSLMPSFIHALAPHHHYHQHLHHHFFLLFIFFFLVRIQIPQDQKPISFSLFLSLSFSFNSHCLKTKADAKHFQPSSNQPPPHTHPTTLPENNHNAAINVKVAENSRRH